MTWPWFVFAIGIAVALALLGALWLVLGMLGNAPARGDDLAEESREGYLPVLNASQLIDRLRLHAKCNAVAQAMGLEQRNADSLVRATLEQVFEFVQLLPASESHHHAGPGGLALHLVDVAHRALCIRSGMELPSEAIPEARFERKHAWTFGVLVVALFHDIGKPLTDIRVEGRDSKGRPIRWQPLVGTMQESGVAMYRPVFPPASERNYEAHARMGIVLLQRCVPREGLQWIASDQQLMDCISRSLAGDATVLTQIVRQADMESVAHDLLHGSRVRFATARSVPLIEILMARLRHLLSGHDGTVIPINSSGAAGFVQGELTWLVVPRVVDLLTEDVKRTHPDRSLPSDRTRIYDTFLEYGAIRPVGGEMRRSVWRIRVSGGTTKEGSAFSHTLTALCFETQLLYRTPPPSFSGRIEVVQGNESAAEPSADASPPPALPPTTAEASAANEVTAPSPARSVEEPAPREGDAPTIQHTEASPPTSEEASSTGEKAAIRPAAPQPNSDKPQRRRPPSPGSKESLAAAQAALAAVQPPQACSPEQSAAASTAPPPASGSEGLAALDLLDRELGLVDTAQARDEPAERSAVHEENPPVPSGAPTLLRPVLVYHAHEAEADAQLAPDVVEFIAWLQAQLGSGEAELNTGRAFLHTLPEGLGLLSPQAFKVYCAMQHSEIKHPMERPQSLSRDTEERWPRLQKALKKSGLLLRSPDGGANDFFHAYEVIDRDTRARLNFMILTEPERFFARLPPPNALLRRAPIQKLIDPKGTRNATVK